VTGWIGHLVDFDYGENQARKPAKYDLDHILVPCSNGTRRRFATAPAEMRSEMASVQFMLATVTRRQAILLLGGAAVVSIQAQTGKPATAIHQEVDFQVPPERIYKALLDAQQFSAFTGLSAEIQAQPGGRLKLFGGLIEARNIELVPNRRIVQAWREASWTPGYYSLVKFELAPRSPGTRLVLDQTGIAENDWGHLNDGWNIRYWAPLHKYLQG
jgi:activator of HSP90 ATPase